MRDWFKRSFFDGEGMPKPVGGAGAVVVVLLVVIVLLEVVVGSANSLLYFALAGTLGYIAGERRMAAPSATVEKVAPPYIPDV